MIRCHKKKKYRQHVTPERQRGGDNLVYTYHSIFAHLSQLVWYAPPFRLLYTELRLPLRVLRQPICPP